MRQSAVLAAAKAVPVAWASLGVASLYPPTVVLPGSLMCQTPTHPSSKVKTALELLSLLAVALPQYMVIDCAASLPFTSVRTQTVAFWAAASQDSISNGK